MEAVGQVLAPYTEQIAKVAGTVTLLQFLSGIILVNEIRKKGNSTSFPSIPFLGGTVLTLLFVKYGMMLRDDAMVKVNFFGFALNVIYLCVYYLYTPEDKKTSIWAKIGLTGIFSIACMVYSEYEDSRVVEFRFGMLVTGVLIFLVGSPLLHLGEIIKTKDTTSLPLPLILSGTIVAISWFCYGMAIRNTVLVFQNAILIALSAIQLSLFVIYPRQPLRKRNDMDKKIK